MNATHYAELVTKVQEWIDAACDGDGFPEVVIGDRTVDLMASAARNVFEACEESQEYGERQGLFKKTV